MVLMKTCVVENIEIHVSCSAEFFRVRNRVFLQASSVSNKDLSSGHTPFRKSIARAEMFPKDTTVPFFSWQ